MGSTSRSPVGRFTAILGASGSGKTTLLRIVAGFERPDQGEVWLGDESPTTRGRVTCLRAPPHRVRASGGRTLPSPQRRAQRGVRPAAQAPHDDPGSTSCSNWSGLSGYRRRYPHQLSGGQQQRVALARALAMEPEIVLLDEPFSSLDAALRASVRAEVLGVLRRAGTTSVLVTHDQDEALSMADQVAVLRDGVVAQLDTPAGLYGRPVDAALAQFLGESNLFEGEVRDGVATTALGRLPGWVVAGPAAGGPAQVMVRPEQI